MPSPTHRPVTLTRHKAHLPIRPRLKCLIYMMKCCVLHANMLKLYMVKCDLKGDRDGYFFSAGITRTRPVRVCEQYETRGVGTGTGLGEKYWDEYWFRQITSTQTLEMSC